MQPTQNNPNMDPRALVEQWRAESSVDDSDPGYSAALDRCADDLTLALALSQADERDR